MIKAVFFDFFGVINIGGELNREIAEFIQINNDKYLFAILSAAEDDLHDWLITHGMNDYFAIVQTTSKVGVSKSNPEFYQRALDLLELSPKEVVFIDDSAVYTGVASELGIKTIKYAPEENFTKQFSSNLS